MPSRIMHCAHCSLNGEIEIQDFAAGVPESRVFKFFGHNPFSGHMHYRCPRCGIILLVAPMDVLGERPFSGMRPEEATNGSFGRQRSARDFFRSFLPKKGHERQPNKEGGK